MSMYVDVEHPVVDLLFNYYMRVPEICPTPLEIIVPHPGRQPPPLGYTRLSTLFL